jgi:hypothetical protein
MFVASGWMYWSNTQIDRATNRLRPCPFETYPALPVPFTMTSVAFPKSIFSELAANLPRHACRTGESITMSSNRSWLSVGITSFNGKISLTFLFLLLAAPAFASGGSCPSGANYLNSATGSLVTLSSLGVTSCYYVSANGSDTNNGISESSPWLHAPQMPNCSANCATVQNQGNGIPPGTGIILRGGDTWHLGNSSASPYTGGEWNFNTGQYPMGTSSNPIYLGVDQSWFSGGSWARPIFTLDNPLCGPSNLGGSCSSGSLPTGITQYYVSSCAHTLSPNNMIDISGLQYYIIDNLELTGLCQNSTGQPSTDNYVRYGSLRNPVTFQNLYIHGWTHVQYAAQNSSPTCNTGVCFDIFAFQGGVASPGPGDILRYDVVDGTDSDPEAGGLCFKGFYDVAYSAFRYVSTCLPGALHSFHDNLYEYFYENGHSDMLAFSENSGVTDVVYNNIFRHVDTVGAGGTPLLWPNPPSSTAVYIFNNLIYDLGSLNCVFCIGNNGSSYGNHFIFNNTLQTSVNQPLFSCQYLSGGALVDANNHFVDDGSVYTSPCNNKTTTTHLVQTNAQATTAGYTSSQANAYSPTLSGSPTVGTGTNENASNGALCSALSNAGLSDAANACQSDTAYACTYSASTHTMSCPAQTVTARPPSGTWDIGAYEYNTQDPPPTPPTGLTATVH